MSENNPPVPGNRPRSGQTVAIPDPVQFASSRADYAAKIAVMPLVYVAGPYRAPTIREISENIERAGAVAADVWRCGAAAVCPHKNSAYFDGVVEDQVFIAGGVAMVAACAAIVLLPRWRESAGSVIEEAAARRLSIPVFAASQAVPGGLLQSWVEDWKRARGIDPDTGVRIEREA